PLLAPNASRTRRKPLPLLPDAADSHVGSEVAASSDAEPNDDHDLATHHIGPWAWCHVGDCGNRFRAHVDVSPPSASHVPQTTSSRRPRVRTGRPQLGSGARPVKHWPSHTRAILRFPNQNTCS